MSLSKGARVNLADLKGQMIKRIGPERSKEYFYYLTRFLSRKLSKIEYEKLCRRLLGRENLSLHNQFMRSILSNALHGKGPPPVYSNGPTKPVVQVKNSLVCTEDGREQRLVALSDQHLDSSVWSNGILSPSPRRIRSGIRDRKLKDRPSPLGPNGKVTNFDEIGEKLIKENGVLVPCDYERPLLHLPAVSERPEEDTEDTRLRPSNKLKTHDKDDETRLNVLKDGADVEKGEANHDSKGPLLAPLGIPNCFASVGWGCKGPPVDGLDGVLSCYECGQLPDSETLRQYMNHVAAAQGLSEVSEESANILNSALDAYLKRLIRSCVQMVSRSHGRSYSDHIMKLQMAEKFRNGVIPSQNHLHLGNSGPNVGGVQQRISSSGISLHDFKVAMELNPNQLGEDWPILLEKISLHLLKR
ncbi:hypothetical protein MLD38_014129 [Melastoma candidum]|uniref:Uncharacterized protein n=1 Tax=Melastoma candidum TaxID=119954 RepID=A0ACB9RBR8_9MYRT|nr:hypothetical protein MLD38_014129 [Melastoma candidum]